MGTHINLLDWRQERRARRQQEFQRQMVLALAAGVAIVLLWAFYAGNRLEAQESRNSQLRAEIQRLDKEIAEIAELDAQQEKLLARMQVIESLQSSRSASVHFFDQLVDTLPDGVHLTRLKQRGEQVTIEGVAESNARVSSYMKQLDASRWFADPRLIVIRSSETNRVRQSEFTLQVRGLRAPETDDASEGAAADE